MGEIFRQALRVYIRKALSIFVKVESVFIIEEINLNNHLP